MAVASGSERFRVPKTSFEETGLVNDTVPPSTKYKNKWAVNIFAEWQSLREVKVPVLDCGGVFKDYELHKVCALSADIAAMDVVSLNFWLSKFVMEVAKKSGERYPPKSVYGIICSLKRHLEERNGSEALNPLDASDKRHTGIVCYSREFFFGGGGIESCLPGGTILGSPDEVVDLGDTEIPQDVFVDYLAGIGEQDFRPENYHLFEHNCNTFSSVVAIFLTGNKIPQHIQDLPSEVLNTSFGRMIRPIIDSMSVHPSGGTPVPQMTNGPDSIFEPRGETEASLMEKPDSGCQSSMLRSKAANTFSQIDYDAPTKVSRLKEDLAKTNEFPENDLNQLDDLKKCFEISNLTEVREIQIQIFDQVIENYLTQEEDHPALQHALQLLQALSLCEQLFTTSKVIKEIIKKTCRTFSNVNSSSRQVECAKLFCCVTSHKTGHSVMFEDSRSLPLAAITVNCLLSNDRDLQTVGAALVTNISRFEIHEDIALECSTAVIEVLSRDISPETGHNCLYALRRFMDYNSEVVGLASVMGVSVDKFKGSCSEVDELCSDLEKLLR